jgi:hypothetical protein
MVILRGPREHNALTLTCTVFSGSARFCGRVSRPTKGISTSGGVQNFQGTLKDCDFRNLSVRLSCLHLIRC